MDGVDTFDVVLGLVPGLPVGVAGDGLLAELGRAGILGGAAQLGALQALVASEAITNSGMERTSEMWGRVETLLVTYWIALLLLSK